MKNVLITGATSDFGRSFIDRFIDPESYTIYLHGRNEERLKEIAASTKVKTEILLCDLDDMDAIDRVFSPLNNIDILINNAGGALGLEKAQDANIDDWDKMIDRNVKSLVHITGHILPSMVAQKSGHIINIGSIAGNWPYPGGHVYCACKAFVKQFSLALRSDLLGTNVRVTNIEPGMVETKFSLNRFKGDKEKADAVYANTNALKAEDISNIVYFAATLPDHVNITSLEVMPTDQALGAFAVHRS